MRRIFSVFISIIFCVNISFSQFESAIELCNTTSDFKSLHPMDFDNDGDLDIIVTSGATTFGYQHTPSTITAHTFGVCENVGSGNFVFHQLIDTFEEVFWSFGDLDGDGLLDFIWAEAYDVSDEYYSLNWRKNNGGFTFGADQEIYGMPHGDDASGFEFQFDQIGVGDIDNDGDNEVLAAMNGLPGEPSSFFTSPFARIYAFQFDGSTFSTPQLLCNTGVNYGYEGAPMLDIIVMDWNEDGLNDIISQWFIGDGNHLGVSYAIADGVFAVTDDLPYNLGYIGPEDITDNANWDYGDVYGDNLTTFAASQPTGSFFQIGGFVNAFYSAIDPEAPGLAILDADLDSDGDIIVPSENGSIYYFEHDSTWPVLAEGSSVPFTANYELLNLNIPYTVSMMTRMDYDGDGDDDLIFNADGHIYVSENADSPVTTANVIVSAFVDSNMNGVQDVSEMGLPNFSVYLDQTSATNPDMLFANTATSQIEVNLFAGNYTVEFIDSFNSYELTTPSSVVLDLSSSLSDQMVSFGLVYTGVPSYDLNATLFSIPGLCESTIEHHFSISNSGSQVASGVVSYSFDAVHGFISASPSTYTLAGNTISWPFSDLSPGAGTIYYVNLYSASVEQIGNVTSNVLDLIIEDDLNNTVYSNSISQSHLITCAYDPNAITENFGHTEVGYVLDGDQLEYTIQFQNLGNASATNVRIENQLSDLLQRNTLHPIASSHDYDLIIDENDKAIFTFNDINLPDATNNEPESHGFITYRILPITNLVAGTFINNTAEIYFDLNPAIVTNTELNTIYDCIDLQQASVSETAVCTGEEITCNNNATWIENLTWSFNGNDVGTGNYTHTVNESGTLTMHASNALCDYTQDFQLTANTANASFTSNGNTLTANDAVSYQWLLDGNEIPGATQQTYEITETGIYSVMVVDANGCDDVSEQLMATYAGIVAFDTLHAVIYPNPAKEKITISINESLIGAGMKICNELGQEVWNSYSLMSLNTEVDCSAFAKGVYTITISNVRSKFVIE